LSMRATNKLLPRAQNAATTLAAADFHIARYLSQRGPQGTSRYRPKAKARNASGPPGNHSHPHPTG
jgi:hypothetical protein